MKGWYGDKQQHGLASRGIKTAKDEAKVWERNKMAGLRNYYISYLDRVRAYDMEDFWNYEDERGLVDGMNEDEWMEHEIKQRLMNYPENARWSEEGNGWLQISGRIYFGAKDKKSAIEEAMLYEFDAMDVHGNDDEVIFSV